MSFKVGDLIRPKLGKKTSYHINISDIKVARVVKLESNRDNGPLHLRIKVLEGTPRDLQVIADNLYYKDYDYKARNYSYSQYSSLRGSVSVEKLQELGGFLVNSQSFVKLTETERKNFEAGKSMNQSSKQVPSNKFLTPEGDNLMLILALS